MNIQGWFPLGLTDLISLLSKGLSRSLLCNTVAKNIKSKASIFPRSAFFMVQLSHPYKTTNNLLKMPDPFPPQNMLFIFLWTHRLPNTAFSYSPQLRCLLLQEVFPDFPGWSQGFSQSSGLPPPKPWHWGLCFPQGHSGAVTAWCRVYFYH